MAAASLPVFIALKTSMNSKYLRYVDKDAQLQGHLQFTGEEAVSPYTKSQLVPAKEEGLVHIRSCYNNKYWTRGNPNSEWIVATADEPVEDRSEWSCTLFEASLLGGGEDPLAIRLRHVQLDQYVSIFTDGGRYESCLIARTAAAEPDMVFTMFDWGGSALVLPKKVVFTGGESTNYIDLNRQTNDLSFSTPDFRLPTVSNEVFYTRDGKVKIRNDFNGMFWKRRQTSWIFADSSQDNEEDPNTLFSLVKPTEVSDDGNVVALRNLGNGRFARRYTGPQGRISGVHATTDFGTIWSDWKVEEPVAARSIYDVVFNLKDARIYSQQVVTWDAAPPILVSNPHDAEQVITVVLPFTTQRTSTWKSIVSIKSLPLDVPTPTINTGIPLIAQGGVVEVHHQFQGPYHWGNEVSESVTTQWSEQITIPPYTTATIQLMATTGKCDVPFSYTQRDTSFNGDQVITYQMNDGIYTCLNSYNFHTQVTLVPNNP